MKNLIIAGITRSGLTMTMQMLNAGGYPCVGEYPSFEEYMPNEIPWEDIQGKAVKLVDTHNQIPPKGKYKVIRLRRNFREQSKSIQKFLQLMCGLPISKSERSQIEKGLPKDYKKIDSWKKKQIAYLDIYFEDIINEPANAAKQIAVFLEMDLDIKAMANTVIKRSTKCYDGLLELEMI